MTEQVFNRLVYLWIALAVLTFPLLLKIAAPYGRHGQQTRGPTVGNRLGWLLMELPSPIVFAFFFLTAPTARETVNWLLFGFWLMHYTYRSCVFPFRLKTTGKRMPLAILLCGVFFNLVNGFLNGYFLGHLHPSYPGSWTSDPRFILGLLCFLSGMFVNWHSDNILLHLRKPGETGYRIPAGGLFRYVSSPNYLGEVVEWGGFALMAWSLPALSFFIWTAANLIPRALANHRWYHENFADYPADRKAFIPFLL